MDSVATILITLGALLLVGLATEALGRRTQIPRVSLLVVFGVVVGPAALGLLPDLGPGWFPTVTNMALVMIGFLLGEQLSLGALRRHGRAVLAVSLAVVLATAALVGAGLIALGAPLPVALLLAAIATSTAPAATLDLVHEGRARGPFTETLLGIVAVEGSSSRASRPWRVGIVRACCSRAPPGTWAARRSSASPSACPWPT
jgi:NhaP-type Na+/H+ or K+/H+ antiporter